ncbi:MAG: hypothetical protein JOY84_13785 [Curvibacter sp.]|nr:hypothetical protein [Curvibacter sp.]
MQHPDEAALPAGLTLPRRQHELVCTVIDRWQDQGVIDAPTHERLRGSIRPIPFDWQKAARYAFLAALACVVIAVGSLLADRMLLALLEQIFSAPAALKCGFFVLLSAVLFRVGLVWRRKSPHRVYRNEALFFLGVLALAAAIACLGAALDDGSGHFSLLLLLAAVLYGLLGLWFPSPLVWVFGLLSLGGWMGAETGYASGFGAYYLGMSYPLRFALFGALLTGLGTAGRHLWAPGAGASDGIGRLHAMSPQTQVLGLLYLFIALWILSIFGDSSSLAVWQSARPAELLPWALLFGLAAIAAIAFGLKCDDGAMRGFGLTFLGINLYTRYFEYFWDSLHKAVFFAILALSLWWLGSRAERLWHWGERPGPSHPSR